MFDDTSTAAVSPTREGFSALTLLSKLDAPNWPALGQIRIVSQRHKSVRIYF